MMKTERTNITNWIRSMSLIASPNATGKRFCGLSESTANIFAQHVNEATALADGWDWTSRQAEYIATQKNWRQLSFVEYWKTYLPIAYGAWI